MRLLHVATVLDVETTMDEGKELARTIKMLKEFYGPALAEKKYAILSHCWGAAEEEVSFQEMDQFMTAGEEVRNDIRRRTGYQKIVDTCRQAQRDDLEWLWVDTCCIDKKSSSELSEAINSMYEWYHLANQCYVYLHDTVGDTLTHWDQSIAIPKWFSRGWTLQELVAPSVVQFFDQNWECIGDREQHASVLNRITRVPTETLKIGFGGPRPSVAQIMSWAADRTTTREEDRAYSLLGLLGVQMPMLYGEGKNAFRRLQLEIIRKSNDQSIFAWSWSKKTGLSDSFLADDPSWFRDCSNVISLSPDEFIKALAKDVPEDELRNIPAKRLRTFTVSNDGIQIWLPTATYGAISEVRLACCQTTDRWEEYPDARDMPLITISVALFPSDCFRFFGHFPKSTTTKVKFTQLFLPYETANSPSSFTFKLDCQALSHNGFVERQVQPDIPKAEDGSIVLSKANDFSLITYGDATGDRHFSVLLMYFRDDYSTFVICPTGELDEEKVALLRLHALEEFLVECWENIKHGHLPRSMQGVRVVPERSYGAQAGCKVTIDVAQCSGCCSPSENTSYHFTGTPRLPGILWDHAVGLCCMYNDLKVDSYGAQFFLTKVEVKLGDYGRFTCNGDRFERQGNIFDLAMKLGADVPMDPVQNIICHQDKWKAGKNPLVAHPERHKWNDDCRHSYPSLALYNAVGWSLPVTQQLVAFLNSLSFRLSDAILVTRIIQCSECYYDIQDSFPSESEGDAQDLSTWREFDTTTPLCSLMTPISWRQVSSSTELVETLRNVRRYFSVLVGFAGGFDEPNDSNGPTNFKVAAEFLKDIFGGGNFNDFVCV
ncbi:heterokaryon incompatibility protein-domain-containing protein [Pisolithus albus]|nr:heterokaryon incompatibility protein-domain-containing protein [Pisolithus albus]